MCPATENRALHTMAMGGAAPCLPTVPGAVFDASVGNEVLHFHVSARAAEVCSMWMILHHVMLSGA